METIKDVEEICDIILQGKIPNLDCAEENLFIKKTKAEVCGMYIKTIKNYFFWLRESELLENFELSQKIIQVLKLEEENFVRLSKLAQWWDKTSLEGIKSITLKFNKIYNQIC